MGLLFPSIRFLKIVVDPSSLCCGEKQFQGVIHPAWKRYSVNPVLAVPGSLDSNGTQTLNSRFPGEGGTNPIPGGRFVLQSVMDVSEILSLTSPRARGGGMWESPWVPQDDALGYRGTSWHQGGTEPHLCIVHPWGQPGLWNHLDFEATTSSEDAL